MSVQVTRTSDATAVLPKTFTTTSDAQTVNPPRVTLTSDAYALPAGAFAITSDATTIHGFTVTSNANTVGSNTLTATSDAFVSVSNPVPPPTPPPPVIIPDPSDPNNATILGRFPCDQHIDCPGTDSPVANYSAEAPDPVRFIGTGYGPLTPPPLGSLFTSLGCFATCYSALSQQDADNCAETQAVLCTSGRWFPPPPPPLPACPFPPCNGVSVYFNQEAFCDGICPDGSSFRYVVPRGTFVSFSQIQADREADSYACRQARSLKVCLGPLTPNEVCVHQSASMTIAASGVNRTPTNFWTLTSGAPPTGMQLTLGFQGSSVTLSGTPTLSGTYSFTLRVVTPGGNYMQKEYTVCVVDLHPASGPLAPAVRGIAYTQQLTADTCTTESLQWVISAGALPPGLSLDPNSGLISGTPTTAGGYSFTVQLTTKAT